MLISPLVNPYAARRRARQLSKARTLVPQIVRADASILPRCAGASAIVRAELTSTDVAVFVLAPEGGPPCAVVKVPLTERAARGVAAESHALAALHGDDRVGDWRRLVPRAWASGTLLGQSYRVDSALPGRVLLDRLGDETARERLMEAAAETIDELHRSTAAPVDVDQHLIARWIDEPIRLVITQTTADGMLGRQLRVLQAELDRALIGRTVCTSRVHGDYWLGNVLFSGSRTSGVVDWDAAGTTDLPLIDLLHLLLYTRRLLSGQELGEIVSEQLLDGRWSRHERSLLGRFGLRGAHGSPSDRHALLLYWLRHVAHHARQEARPRGPANRLWVRRNVRPVLAALKPE
jgi:aminoglycoside phosphotransferase (APT) family kinase protein